MTNSPPTVEARPSAGDEVGIVVAVTADGKVTLRGNDVPEGTLVEDRRGKFSGRVVKVFGPVAKPYISVRPRRTPGPEEMLSMIGEMLFVRER